MQARLNREKINAYHWHRPSTGLFLGYLEVQKRAVLVGVVKVQLVETTDACEQDAIVKLLHIATRLEHDGWIDWSSRLLDSWRKVCLDDALGKVLQIDDRLGLLAPNLLALDAWE